MSDAPSVDAALAAAHRDDWALVVGATVRTVRDLDLAEECVQEAYADALRTWPTSGVPANPAAWLTTTARRRAVDVVRREQTLRAKLSLLVEPDHQSAPDPASGHPGVLGAELDDMDRAVPDDRLRLVLLCAHPALGQDARVALTLRLVCGVSTADIARAFLVPEATMAARLTRAKRKIVGSGIAFRLPDASMMPERLQQVAELVHLLFTTGHAAPSGDDLVRADLVDEAVRLARLLAALVPASAEMRGLLALLLATDARRTSRTDEAGGLIRLPDQDRGRWDRAAVAEARSLLLAALPDPSAGRYCLQAAIAVLHAEAPSSGETDWPQVLGLHDRLLAVWPNPVVALNRAVALAEVRGPEAGLAAVDALANDDRLREYPYLYAVRADLLARSSRPADAAAAYRAALSRTENAAEVAFLRNRVAEVDGSVRPERPARSRRTDGLP